MKKINWIEIVKAVAIAIISALSAIGTSQTADALNLFGQ